MTKNILLILLILSSSITLYGQGGNDDFELDNLMKKLKMQRQDDTCCLVLYDSICQFHYNVDSIQKYAEILYSLSKKTPQSKIRTPEPHVPQLCLHQLFAIRQGQRVQFQCNSYCRFYQLPKPQGNELLQCEQKAEIERLVTDWKRHEIQMDDNILVGVRL